MRNKVKSLWLSALRSGDYQQTSRALREETPVPKFCCLGVLCELAVQEGVLDPRNTKVVHQPARCKRRLVMEYMGATGTLPVKVMLWAGLNEKQASKLIHMNDSGCLFEEIADTIEETL